DPLFIPLHERDALVGELTALRDRYGEKVGFTRAMARQFLSRQAFQQWNSLDTCPVTSRVLCFRSDGSPKVCTRRTVQDAGVRPWLRTGRHFIRRTGKPFG
ncbi:MAG: hypothetical protein JRH05_10530, partial [Deltaproteobacteria bacterium]|nr:hypothetical protein [Deltaproteobacteria bacterium]